MFSCGSYRNNIMFRVPGDTALQKEIASAETNYRIQAGDLISVQVYTNEGERLVDPDFQLLKETPSQSNLATVKPDRAYLIEADGTAKMPMVGNVSLGGLSIREAESILQQAYGEFYEKPFVTIDFKNKRVVVLGAPGGKVIPLSNNNVTLAEVLALAEGIDKDANATNIRVLRGNEAIVVDFSTFDGYRKGNIIVNPGDVVYVEPVRRPFAESIRDYAPLVTILASITTLIVVLVGL
jgi:Periplasmic protein involved in polysaccharide export